MTADDRADRDAASPAVDRQIRALTEIIGSLAEALSRLSARVDHITAEAQSKISANDDELAPWVWEHPDATANDPESIVEGFVTFYNRTYVGIDGSRARPIPICWKDHPALVAEVATLAYSWRTANVGTTANVRDAQYWLHQWRPAFTDRLVRDWAPMDCFESTHGHDALFTAGKPLG